MAHWPRARPITAVVTTAPMRGFSSDGECLSSSQDCGVTAAILARQNHAARSDSVLGPEQKAYVCQLRRDGSSQAWLRDDSRAGRAKTRRNVITTAPSALIAARSMACVKSSFNAVAAAVTKA